MNSHRRIAHLDMDAFFASVELQHYPMLRGQPVVVGGRRVDRPLEQADGSLRFARLRDYVGRGVITTSTYEARALGVFSGMGLMKAAQLAPDAILLPANFDAYRDYSRRFKAAVASVAPVIEDRGIDEIYIDLSGIAEDSLPLARRIKQAVFAATGLTCSIGITPNKLLAKIASDLDKPDGITILGADDVPTRIWPLAARKINGIGPKAAERLRAMGVDTVGQLAAVAESELVRRFGASTGSWLWRAARGIDERPLVTERDPKSVSRESTFERDLDVGLDRAALSEAFTGLCARVADDLARKGLVARTIGIKLRFADFSTVTRDLTLPEPLADARAIRQAAGQCLKRIALGKRIRLLGVRAAGLQAPMATPAAAAVQAELQLF
ncbi:DNA polymerase IV [Azonexus sp.]|uniref:DNA polymerase IV n=1 Tax=Azonexus sp. TaxID=1872668 RepID=UPI0035B3B2CF